MAHIVGYTPKTSSRPPAAHTFFPVLIAVILTGLMLFPLEDTRENLLAVTGVVAVIVVLVGLALNRTDPMLWKKIFHKREYEQLVVADAYIYQSLQALDDRHYVLCNFNLELLHVNFLVLGPKGIAVIDRSTADAALSINQGTLMAGADSLEKITGNLWRKCHLISLIIKKGYSLELMPRPILVMPDNQNRDMNEFDGIAIVFRDNLVQTIENMEMKNVPYKTIEGFAAYLEQRYIR